MADQSTSHPLSPPDAYDSAWTLGESMRVLGAVLVAGPLVLGLIGVGVLPGLEASGSTTFWAAVSIIYYGLPVMAMGVVGYHKPGGVFAAVGFRRPRLRWLLIGSIVGLYVATSFNLVYTALMTMVGFDAPEASMQVMEQLTASTEGGPWATAISVLLVVLVAPVVEEAIFRGVLFQGLARRIGPIWAIIASSAVFALIHLDLWRALPLAFLGGVLGFLTWQSRSIWPAVLTHALVNGFAYVVALAMAAG